jgi:hypothetical protein
MKPLKFLPPVLILIALTSTAVMADSAKSVTIVNNTTYTMTQLYASSTYHSDSWSGATNLLTSQSVGPGQTLNVPISDGTDYCHYDFMGILYGAAQTSYQYVIDTCDSGNNVWTVTN